MKYRSMRLLGLALAWLLLWSVAVAQEKPDPPKPAEVAPPAESKVEAEAAEAEEPRFLRLTRTEDDSLVALETAIVRHVPVDSKPPRKGKKRRSNTLTVDLVSAVHIAEKEYYQELNKRFQEYDVVLYELVAPEGTQVPEGGVERGGHPVSRLQFGMTAMLELEFQLNGVDYTADNFVHADMSPEQFTQSMRDRGESVFQMFCRMMGYAMAKGGSSSGGDMRLLMAFFDKNRAMALKRAMAEQFEDMEGSLMAINGPNGSTIITERNKVALEVLREQIDEGHRKLAIFYGGGHMSDMQERLLDDFQLEPSKTEWIVAWDLTDEKSDR